MALHPRRPSVIAITQRRPVLAAALVLLAMLAVQAVPAARDVAAGPGAAAHASTLPHRMVLPALVREGYPGTSPYTVQPGDTLFSIAQRFGTTVAVIAALNGIEDPSQIRAGDYFYIPGRAPTPAGPSRLVRNGSRTSSRVALTFDMGGRVDPALDIMEWLVANSVRATIFFTGAIIDSPNTDAGRQVLAIVNAHPHLFEVGNHSYSHADFTTLSDAQVRAELQSTEAAAAAHTALRMQPRFRPPFGAVDADVLAAAGAAGYGQTVMWDVDTIDWRPESEGGPTAQEIVTFVAEETQGGSIVLMHLGGYNTLEALPGIVSNLRGRGFELARVSELPLP